MLDAGVDMNGNLLGEPEVIADKWREYLGRALRVHRDGIGDNPCAVEEDQSVEYKPITT